MSVIVEGDAVSAKRASVAGLCWDPTPSETHRLQCVHEIQALCVGVARVCGGRESEDMPKVLSECTVFVRNLAFQVTNDTLRLPLSLSLSLWGWDCPCR